MSRGMYIACLILGIVTVLCGSGIIAMSAVGIHRGF